MRIDTYTVVFWDFDGVIKDSVDVKTEAFVRLFEEHGSELAEKVRNHHLENGGMSRYDKFPLYARWAGKELTSQKLDEYSKKFSSIALQGVLDSAWVPGVEGYLRKNHHSQTFILVSATPQDELVSILDALNLKDYFKAVFGAPLSKRDAIARVLAAFSVPPNNCLMIGDARADLEAAESNGVSFLLRLHDSNRKVFANYTGASVRDFLDL